MDILLRKLDFFSYPELFFIFLLENLIVCLLALVFGHIMIKAYHHTVKHPTRKDILFCLVTVFINTIITLIGYILWKQNFITLQFDLSLSIITDLLILFLAMDFLMYIFHLLIHRTFLYKQIHLLHHEAIDPKPIDLFVLHPLETIGFGMLWLILILVCPFNIYAIIIYLSLNVLFGVVGYLGFEPFSMNFLKNTPIIRFLGTSNFHHTHHREPDCNFGFYTNIWDKLFRTYQK